MSALGRAAIAATLALVPACRGCRQTPETASADAGSGAREVPLELAPKPLAAAPAWRDDPSPRGIAVPAGCTLELPLKKAALAPGTRFFAEPRVLDALAIATGTGADVSTRALVDLASGHARALPWDRLDTPPLVARAELGWTAALVEAVDGAVHRALLWREGRPALELARGDRLELADLACQARRCALLTTLARPAAAPGATLALGDPGRSDGWRRVDVPADPGAPWQPLAIARLDAESAEIVLGTGSRVAVYRVQAGAPEKLGEVAVPHGSWDVVTTPQPLVVAAGADVDAGCALDPFPLRLAPLSGRAREVGITIPPDGVIARPLAKGAFVAWVAPVSCQDEARVIVHALRIDERGVPSTSPMGVADATGFSLATSGDRVSLWLRTTEGVTWVRARCP